MGDELKVLEPILLARQPTKGRGATIELDLQSPGLFNHVVIMEDIAYGEHVRKYTIEALTKESGWRKVCDGESIGHKRIQMIAREETMEATKIRLRATQSVATPVIRELAVYNI